MHKELRNEIISLLSKGTRLDGRKFDQYRDVTVEMNVSANAEGSARVKIGDTEVIAGIKMEVMKPYPDNPDEGSLMVNVELYPLSSPDFEAGPPSIDSIELARITDRAIRESKMIDVKALCITPNEKAWMVIIDICSINVDGNLFNAMYLAALAALENARFPEFDGEEIDYKNHTDKKLPLSERPVSVTVFKYGDHLLVDPGVEEEKCYDLRLTVGVRDDGKLCSMQKGGEDSTSVEKLGEMMDLAMVKAKELRAKVVQ